MRTLIPFIFGIVAGGALAAAALCSSAAHADTDFRALLVSAIDAPDGRAQAIVEGKVARDIQQRIGTTASVVAEVRAIKSWQQEGCKRLAVKLSTPNFKMKTTGGKMEPFGVEYQINVCHDGHPPPESIDWSKVSTGASGGPLQQNLSR